MSKIRLLDCTLRDGGYINQWHFGRNVIRDICTKLYAAKLEIIEVGFLTDLPHTPDDSLYGNVNEIADVCCKSETGTQYAAMIAIGEKEMDPVSLPPANDSVLDIVRITFHRTPDEIDKAVKYAKCLMEKGYKVCMQPVGTTSYTDKQLIELIEIINELKPYAFYLVDTLGILCREELTRFIYLIDYNLAEGIKIGFHSHNNLQLSFANAQFILEYRSSREFIVDCSVYGMGRGAGNLCTELIAQYANQICRSSYSLVSIYEVLDEYIYPIRLKYEWGYNSHYYVAAVHRCHPSYASFLMNKQTLTMNEVDLILKNIPAEKKNIYDKSLIDSLYYSFQNHDVDDSATISYLKEMFAGRNILLLAPGQSIRQNKRAIQDFIEKNSPIVISINGQFDGYRSDLVFISNLKRFFSFNAESVSSRVIVTSNLPNIIGDCLYVDYSKLCSKEHDEPDNSGLMLIRLMIRLGIKQLNIAGFDGFAESVKNNYFDDKMINSVSPDNTELKNEAISKQLNLLKQDISITSLTSSLYFKEKD